MLYCLYPNIVLSRFHQKVAYDPPQLELKATYGLVSPEDYQGPNLNPLWTVEVYKKMDAKMAPKTDKQVGQVYSVQNRCCHKK